MVGITRSKVIWQSHVYSVLLSAAQHIHGSKWINKPCRMWTAHSSCLAMPWLLWLPGAEHCPPSAQKDQCDQKHLWQPQNRYSRKVGNQAILVLNIICTYLYHPGSCSILFGDPYKLKMCQNHPKPEGIALRKTMKVRKRISECLQVMDRLDLGIECRDITRFIMRIWMDMI